MKLFGAADVLTTTVVSFLTVDEIFDLEDIDDDEFLSLLTTSIAAISTLSGGNQSKEIKEQQAIIAQYYIDSLSTEQLAKFDELLNQKEMEMLSKDSYEIPLKDNLVATVSIDDPNKKVVEKTKTLKMSKNKSQELPKE